MRVVVDRDLCQGHGVCESEAPGVFSVSKQGELTILDDSPSEDRRAAVEQAVRFCPTGALRIEDAGRGSGSGSGAGGPAGEEG